MRRLARVGAAWAAFALLACAARPAAAEPSATIARTLGHSAVASFIPGTRFSLVRVPASANPFALGLRPVVPGLAVIEGDAARIAGFAGAHPDCDVILSPPLRTKLDREIPFIGAEPAKLATPAGSLDGRGTYVGIVDTGLDILHADFRNADGTTRIAWFLDYARPSRAGNALDQEYGGRVYDKLEIDAILNGAMPPEGVPGDDEGHGTHVAGIAAGNGGPAKKYVGVAPGAELIVVRVSDAAGNIDDAKAILGAKFVFDRAKDAGKPAVVNMSLGTQYGAHDGTSDFERGLVALAKGPGRAIVVAASNEGHLPIHTSVRLARGANFRIPIRLPGVDGRGAKYGDGQVYAWIALRDATELSVGVRGPNDEVYLPLLPRGSAFEARPAERLRVIVANDEKTRIGGASPNALVVLAGALPVGNVELELEGDAAVDVWLQGSGQAVDGAGMALFARGGQVEGTIGVPASASGLISIGCAAARTSFVNRSGEEITIEDQSTATKLVTPGTRCFFSSAGPSFDAAMRPDVLAPGLWVISSMARSAALAAPRGEFSNEQIIDEDHGALAGTSMSSPFGAGAAALLFQKDPTLTQEGIRDALQAGARATADDPKTGGSYRDHAKGAGILDVSGALAALDRKVSPPAATALSMRFGATWLAADGKLPVWVLALAKDAEGKPADVEGGLALDLDGALESVKIDHPQTGLYRFAVVAAPGRGATRARIGVRGKLSVAHELPVGADRWDANDGLTSGGGCTFTQSARPSAPWSAGGMLALVLTSLGRSRSRSRAASASALRSSTGGPDPRR